MNLRLLIYGVLVENENLNAMSLHIAIKKFSLDIA